MTNMRAEDLEFHTTQSGFHKMTMRITHRPSGISVKSSNYESAEGFLALRYRLLDELEAKVKAEQQKIAGA